MDHAYYNVANFPRLVWARRDSNWHIYADERGNCAAIPVVDGCLASSFGTLQHVAQCKRDKAARRGFPLRNRKLEAYRATFL